MIIVCINCGYFLNCKYASEHITDCDKFVKANRVITRVEYDNPELLEKGNKSE